MRTMLGLLLLLGVATTWAQTAPKGFDAYKTVRTRNIFDPNRHMATGEPAARPATAAAPAPPGYLVLTGTMVTEQKKVAFFTGSRSEYNRVIALNEKIADCTVQEIAGSHVGLQRGEQKIILPLGRQLTLDAAAKISTPVEPETPAPVATTPSTSSPSALPPGVPPDRAELLRRMMERRSKETSR